MRAFSGSPLLVFAAMVLLAAPDFLGTVFAKEWAERHNHWLFAAGLLASACCSRCTPSASMWRSCPP
jgi:hypothetical protein